MNEIPDDVRLSVRHRSNGNCEGCGQRPADDMAHRQRRDTRLHVPSNLLHLCRGCHAWAHANPQAARFLGWIVLTTENPTAIYALRRSQWVELTDGGTFLTVDDVPPAVIEACLTLVGPPGVRPPLIVPNGV